MGILLCPLDLPAILLIIIVIAAAALFHLKMKRKQSELRNEIADIYLKHPVEIDDEMNE